MGVPRGGGFEISMPIVSSKIVEDSPQKDGRRAVRELHVDSLGREQFVSYLAEKAAKLADMLPIRAAQIDEQLKAAEIAKAVEHAEAVGGFEGFEFEDCTPTDAKLAIAEMLPEKQAAADDAADRAAKLEAVK